MVSGCGVLLHLGPIIAGEIEVVRTDLRKGTGLKQNEKSSHTKPKLSPEDTLAH